MAETDQARRAPVFAVLGNHDSEGGEAEEMITAPHEGGVHLLEREGAIGAAPSTTCRFR